MKPTCENLEPFWDLFLDGCLDADQAAVLQNHLAYCADCRREFAAEQRLRLTLRGLPTMSLPEASARRLAALTDQPEPKEQPTWWRSLTSSWRWVPWPAAAAMLAVAAFLVFRGPATPPDQEVSGYSRAAIQQARAQATWCLALATRIIRDSEKQAVTEVFGDKLPAAVRSTLLRPAEKTEGGQG